MKRIGSGSLGYLGIGLSALTLLALAGCGATRAANSVSSSIPTSATPITTPVSSPTPDLAAARTAGGAIIVPLPGAPGVWGGCTQLASDFADCPFAPVLIARLNYLSSLGYFGDGPPGVCGEDYISGTQNGLFVAPQVLSATAETNGTVTVVIERGPPPPKLTATMTVENGVWLATDLASGAGPAASIFSAKPNC
jgi:hypothetical protein